MVGGEQHGLVAGDVGLGGEHVQALRAGSTRRGFQGEGGDTAFGHAGDVLVVERIEHAKQHGAGLHLRQLAFAGRDNLQHQFRAERIGGSADLRADSFVGGIRLAGADARTALDDHLMALPDQFLDRLRRCCDPRLTGLGLEGYTDLHSQISCVILGLSGLLRWRPGLSNWQRSSSYSLTGL